MGVFRSDAIATRQGVRARCARAQAVVVAAVLLVCAGSRDALAQQCRVGKNKCVAHHVTRLLSCYRRALTNGVAVDQDCLDRSNRKFDGGAEPSKGCFEKLEAKYPASSANPCTAYDDTSALESDIDDFIADVIARLATQPHSYCANKTICVGKLAKALLKCHAAADHAGIAVGTECLDEAKSKFDGGGMPCVGCFRRLEDTHPPASPTACPTFEDTHALSLTTRAFVECVATRLADPASAPCAPVAPTCGLPECKRFPGQVPDCSYAPIVADPPYGSCAGPKILVDNTHANFHQITPLSVAHPGRYWGFARLLSEAGYDVRDSYVPLPDLLPTTDAKILVIANPRECGDDSAEAIGANDVAAIIDWAQNGGSLLLIIDHQPFERVGDLLSALGIDRLPGGSTRDPECSLSCDDCPKKCQTYLRSDSSLNGTAAIANGPNPPTTAVDQVSTFTGTAFSVSATPPPGATYEPVLVFPPGSRARSTSSSSLDIGGYLQGVAIQFGAGRVYLSGEAGGLTAQRTFGMQFTPQNERFLLNVIDWLDD